MIIKPVPAETHPLSYRAEIALTHVGKQGVPRVGRAKLLENTSLFKNIHAETAATGQAAPPEDLNVDLRFTCFVEAPDFSVRTSARGEYSKRLIELDGARDGPVDHGRVNDFLKVRNDPSSFWHVG